MTQSYKKQLKELKEIDIEMENLRSFFDGDFVMKNEECQRFMEQKDVILHKLSLLEERQKEIIDSQKKRSDGFNENRSRSWRAGIKKPCSRQEFLDKKRDKDLICSRGPNGMYHWLPTGNIGDPFNIDYLTSINVKAGETLPKNKDYKQQFDMFKSPYDPRKMIQTNPQLSKSVQVFQGNSPLFRDRIMREANEMYSNIESDSDTRDSKGRDWQNMYSKKNSLSDIAEDSKGGGKKKKSRKKSRKKRKKSKKRTKRKVKNAS